MDDGEGRVGVCGVVLARVVVRIRRFFEVSVEERRLSPLRLGRHAPHLRHVCATRQQSEARGWLAAFAWLALWGCCLS